jgi:hypothetical protein
VLLFVAHRFRFHFENHFKFLRLPNDFKKESFRKAIRDSFARNHPDVVGGDNEAFIRTNELEEIFNAKDHYWFQIYNLFFVDPRSVFYDKLAHKDFAAFHAEAINTNHFSLFAVLISHVMIFEEISTSNFWLALTVCFHVVGMLIRSLVIYDPVVQNYSDRVVQIFRDRPFFKDLTYFELNTLIKYVFSFCGLMIVALHLFVKSKSQKKNFDCVWEEIAQTVKKGGDQLEGKTELVKSLATKVDKRIKNHKKEMKSLAWTVLLTPVIVVLNHFDLLPKLITYVQGMIWTGV